MALRQTALGVDVQDGRVFLALLELRGREAVVKRLVETAPPESASEDRHRVLAAVVARAIRDEALKADTLVIALPIRSTIIRRLHVPLTGRRKVAPALTFAIEPLVPFPAEDYYADYLPITEDGGGTDLLAFAARRDEVAPLVQAFEQTGYAPDFVTPDLVPLLDALPPPADGPDAREAVLFAHGNRSFIALREHGKSAEIRALRGRLGTPEHRRQAQRSLRTLAGGGAALSRVLLVDDAGDLTDLCEEVGVPAAYGTLNLPATVPDSIAAAVGDVRAWDAAICLAAQGLGRTKHRLNLRQGDLQPDPMAVWLGPARRVGVLALATLVIYASSLAVQRWALRMQRDELRRGVQERFANVLPGATTVSTARSKIQDLTAAHADLAPFITPGPNVLDVLTACDAAVRAVPKIHVESLTVSGDVLRLTGDVADFRAVTALQAGLDGSPMFSEVTTNKAGESRREGRTSFRLSARVNPRATLDDIDLPAAGASPILPAARPAPPTQPPPPPGADLFDDSDVTTPPEPPPPPDQEPLDMFTPDVETPVSQPRPVQPIQPPLAGVAPAITPPLAHLAPAIADDLAPGEPS